MDDLRALYEDVILDHNRDPRNYNRKPDGVNREAHGYNPLCGDEVQVYLRVNDGTVEDASFAGRGCAICTASASMMTEAVGGQDEATVRNLFGHVHAMLTDDEPPPGDDVDLGSLEALEGVKGFPMRIKCASLAWHTLKSALNGSDKDVTTE